MTLTKKLKSGHIPQNWGGGGVLTYEPFSRKQLSHLLHSRYHSLSMFTPPPTLLEVSCRCNSEGHGDSRYILPWDKSPYPE